MEQLRPAAEAPRSHPRSPRQLVQRGVPPADEHVAGRRPRRHGRQQQPWDAFGGQVLEAVDGQIGPALQHGPLDLLGEDALRADLADRSELLIAAGGQEDQLDLDAQLLQPGCNPVGLPTRQGAAAGPDSQTRSRL